jgi:predicted HAD superfamily Cof-like phosphohydrolase
MNKAQQLVLEFHRKMGFTVNQEPTKLSDKLWRIRYNNTIDELVELQLAEQGLEIGMSGIEEVADALGDLLYFIYGTAVAHGIDMEPVLEEIHRSNMTKDPPTTTDGKAVKGPNYRPPDLLPIIKRLRRLR